MNDNVTPLWRWADLGFDGVKKCVGYYDTRKHWNGWLMPWVPVDVLVEMLKEYNDYSAEPATYAVMEAEEDGKLRVVQLTWDWTQAEGYKLSHGDTYVHELEINKSGMVYAGDFGWCWEEVAS